MATQLTDLELRQPLLPWMVTGSVAALGLYGLLWFLLGSFVSLEQPGIETRQLMISGVFWTIAVLALWRLNVPRSRLHAVMSVLTCVVAVGALGTFVSVAVQAIQGAVINKALIANYLILGGALLLAQLFLAIPSAIILQQIVLMRLPAKAE